MNGHDVPKGTMRMTIQELHRKTGWSDSHLGNLIRKGELTAVLAEAPRSPNGQRYEITITADKVDDLTRAFKNSPFRKRHGAVKRDVVDFDLRRVCELLSGEDYWTAKDIAGLVHCPQQTVNSWMENNKRERLSIKGNRYISKKDAIDFVKSRRPRPVPSQELNVSQLDRIEQTQRRMEQQLNELHAIWKR